MVGGAAPSTAGIGEDSSDECCVCGESWSEGQGGWILCDTDGCDSTVCPRCTAALALSVGELFYCPMCAGSGQSAAATAGGAVATAVAACAELERLPLSFETTRKILTNLRDKPNEPKYRKLRLENKSVKELVDLEPVLNILSSVGFTRTQCARQKRTTNANANLPPTEEVLLLEGQVPLETVNELLEILNGLAPCSDENNDTSNENEGEGAKSGDAEKKRGAKEPPPEEGKSGKKPKAE